ncbi:MAG: cytochrome c nitrite reductase small subunit [Deltaproteobacteria bacterium]|jgi:cytochrome c nitrite reductase small subunit|nr:cytochrome c nitrite reductase small subunit [Deltaproteobacteria bacterium]
MVQKKYEARNFFWLWLIFGLAGLFLGLGGYTGYASRAWTYVSDEPAVCTNCHVMGPYYQSWHASSHAVKATCNDCHVPQDKLARKWAFKATDGLYHAAVFALGAEPQVIRAREGTKEVLQENCLRCHAPLVTELVKMSPDYEAVRRGDNKACWDCHRDIAHTRLSSISSVEYGSLPLPASPVPAWLESMLKKSK